MKGKPQTIYSDDEGGLISNETSEFLKSEGIHHIVTRNHAGQAERGIRTVKDMIFKRLEQNPDKVWQEVLFASLLTYNTKMIQSTIGMTPEEAMKPRNQMKVKAQLEIKRISKRKYPDINVGDKVKLFTKKDKLDKERKPVWSAKSYIVESITESHGQKYYKLTGFTANRGDGGRVFLRHELLLDRTN